MSISPSLITAELPSQTERSIGNSPPPVIRGAPRMTGNTPTGEFSNGGSGEIHSGIDSDGRIHRFGGVIAALDPPHRPIADALHRLGRCPETTITAFTDGDKMLRGYLLKAGIKERPVLDWPHLTRRVQVAKTTARGMKAHTNREYRALPAIRRLLDSLHWRLWHAQTAKGRRALSSIERRLEAFDIRCRRPEGGAAATASIA